MSEPERWMYYLVGIASGAAITLLILGFTGHIV